MGDHIRTPSTSSASSSSSLSVFPSRITLFFNQSRWPCPTSAARSSSTSSALSSMWTTAGESTTRNSPPPPSASAVHGWSLKEGRGADVLKGLLDIWDALRQGDTDGDDQVDTEEWCTLWKNGCSEPWQLKYKDLIFDLHDTSGDGSIGEDEFVAVNAMGDVTADDCKAAFKKLTSNGSGELTRDAYTKLFNEYFVSDDVNAAGNYIFGRSKF